MTKTLDDSTELRQLNTVRVLIRDDTKDWAPAVRSGALIALDKIESALRELIADAENLRGFAQQLLGEWPDVGGEDGFALQEYALKFGLLEQKMPLPTEPCGEGCNCMGYFDSEKDGVTCYRKTARLKGRP